MSASHVCKCSALACFPVRQLGVSIWPVPRSQLNHYATLGLDRRCSGEQIREAYRVLAKKFHPDLNPGSVEAVRLTQQLNGAYEILSDPETRRLHDESLAAAGAKPKRAPRTGGANHNVAQDLHLRLAEFFRGASLEVRVNDPGNPAGPEIYVLDVPPGTAPGARFRIPRESSVGGGHVVVRVRARPDFRFKVRGSDLRCDLRINTRRAAEGGTESVRGPLGDYLRVQVPRGVARGEVIRIASEGLPGLRGGRGDLLVRIVYRPEVSIRRQVGRGG